jgi:hypothetical protein
VTVDGRHYQFSEGNLEKIAFAPSLENGEREIMLFIEGSGTVEIPVPAKVNVRRAKLVDTGGKKVKSKLEDGTLRLEVDEVTRGQWLTLKW